MPADFDNIIKCCENCGSILKLKSTRDTGRKRFCSRQCLHAIIQPQLFVPPHSDKTKAKMRASKLSLLAQGWKPLGWRKYLPHKRLSGRGYVFVGNKREHQVLMEQKLGRHLFCTEVVHHKDRDKANNDINNFELMMRSDHTKYHLGIRRGEDVSSGI